MMSVECEKMEAAAVRGEKALDLAAYCRATQLIGVTLQRLGIAAKTQRDVDHHPQSLRSYVAAVEGEGDA